MDGTKIGERRMPAGNRRPGDTDHHPARVVALAERAA